jgi:hypothetical protein
VPRELDPDEIYEREYQRERARKKAQYDARLDHERSLVPPKRTAPMGCVGCVVLVVAAVGVVAAVLSLTKDHKPTAPSGASSSKRTEPAQNTGATAPTSPPTKPAEPAEAEGRLRPKAGAYPVLAESAATWKRYDDALLTDKATVVRLTQAKAIVPILPAGVTVVKLGEDGEFTRVRVAEGEHKGREFVVKSADVAFEPKK